MQMRLLKKYLLKYREELKKHPKTRVFFGYFFVILGVLLHLIPLFPAGWIIVLGLELLGVRLLFWDKIKEKLANWKIIKK
jgi:hypothetical protein